ncbi:MULTISPECIES: EamA family transporter [Kitasatospora]|uniref:Inner membrane transporter RhtA n=2 Tax=Kitasatospora TaxID=2063 RepID=A0ABT1J6E5_9ACTN|nr:EamA family transporter [Kitasatospora paracochleata]MCP2313014.1 inner membrane transporter RhtA [Kitasatospora paracochleata]
MSGTTTASPVTTIPTTTVRAAARPVVDVRRRARGVPAPVLCVVSMVAVQLGIAASKPLFGVLGVAGATFLRLFFAAAVLLAVTRPRLRGRSRRDLGLAGLLGVASAGMTALFAGAVDRLPMGTAATIEFLGPLAVALIFARRAGHVLWALLAGCGVALLTLFGTDGPNGAGLDPVGLAYAFGAAACYAGYILFTDKVGAVFKGFEGLAVSFTIATVALAPFGAAEAWHGLATADTPWLLLLAVAGVALLFPVLPYALEMTALRRMEQRVFSVIVSLDPAVSATVGLVVLGQLLGLPQVLGIGCVVLASVGATLTSRR